jgi:hypothetical protein
VVSVFVATALVSLKFGGILDNQSFKGGFGRVVRKLSPEDEKNFAWLEDMLEKMPRNASVATTDRLGSHVSNRSNVYFYKQTTKPYQFILLDEHELKEPESVKLKEDQACGAVTEVGRRGSLVLFQTHPRGPECKQDGASK